jgi:polysaccharide export outer membrane protein
MRTRDSLAKLLGIGIFLLPFGSLLIAQTPAGPAAAHKRTPNTAISDQSAAVQTAGTQPPAPDAGKAHDDNFLIGNDDVLAISVWKEPDISRSVPVRSDGKISLPLVGEIRAAGKTPLKLEGELISRLDKFITNPQVTVIVEVINSQKFNILGQVQKPGSYALTRPTSVLDAIALAGGFRDFAKQKDIYILRRDAHGNQARIPFNYKDVIKGKKPEQNVPLEPDDTLVVP